MCSLSCFEVGSDICSHGGVMLAIDLKMGSPEHLDAAPVYDNPVVDNQVMEERNPTLDIIGLYAQVIVDTVRSLYDTAEEEPNVVYFGNMEATLPKRKYAMSASFARSPWLSGCLPQPPPISLVNKFSTWISRDNDSDLDSLWFEHKFPRMLRVNAVCVKQQFFGAHPLDHEVAVLALRRFNQLDVEAQAVSKYLLWREVLEPDFSTHALAGEKVAHIKAVQLQIAHAHHDITACQTFYTPVILDHGWAAYMWDMIRKEIHILDPLCAQPVGAEKRHATHQEAVSQIHEALFSCLNEFFARWHCTSDRWKRKSPKITREVFTRDESGMCMLHAIRHYDGEKMTWPLTKVSAFPIRTLCCNLCCSLFVLSV
uniref:Ubiquitin-like protease family profile domain-containing protein n=1 Tax=Aegilops tauschii subsp. strangulata TaxID=200361 RepID=A0A453SB93_AEGTS